MLGTGVPGVFNPYWKALTEHLWRYATDQVTRSWQTIPALPTFDDVLNLWHPARTLVPELPAKYFKETADTFNTAISALSATASTQAPASNTCTSRTSV